MKVSKAVCEVDAYIECLTLLQSWNALNVDDGPGGTKFKSALSAFKYSFSVLSL